MICVTAAPPTAAWMVLYAGSGGLDVRAGTLRGLYGEQTGLPANSEMRDIGDASYDRFITPGDLFASRDMVSKNRPPNRFLISFPP